MADYYNPEVREVEKRESREREMRALADGTTTLETLQQENSPIRLSHERIRFEISRSPLW